MTEVISVRFNDRGKLYFFDPGGLTIKKGTHVIVETAKGIEFGECVYGNHSVSDNAVKPPLRLVTRIATETDKQTVAEGKAKEQEAFDYCLQKIKDFRLDMKLVNVEYGFDGNKILFFFTSDGRVDFRELVKDLAGAFRTRIELRQIGVRDEAKMLGGLGVCGREFCCSKFLSDFHPVSIKMAKTQGLSLNPTKISGTCGRLMCCLKYEEAAYEELVKKAPKSDAFVETPSGKGTVININLLRRNAKVRLEDGTDTTLKTFSFDEMEILGGKGRRAEYITAKAEGKLEEAGFRPSPQPAPETTQRFVSLSERDADASRKQTGRQDRRPTGEAKASVNVQGTERKKKTADKPIKAIRADVPRIESATIKKKQPKRHRGGKGKKPPSQ